MKRGRGGLGRKVGRRERLYIGLSEEFGVGRCWEDWLLDEPLGFSGGGFEFASMTNGGSDSGSAIYLLMGIR